MSSERKQMIVNLFNEYKNDGISTRSALTLVAAICDCKAEEIEKVVKESNERCKHA